MAEPAAELRVCRLQRQADRVRLLRPAGTDHPGGAGIRTRRAAPPAIGVGRRHGRREPGGPRQSVAPAAVRRAARLLPARAGAARRRPGPRLARRGIDQVIAVNRARYQQGEVSGGELRAPRSRTSPVQRRRAPGGTGDAAVAQRAAGAARSGEAGSAGRTDRHLDGDRRETDGVAAPPSRTPGGEPDSAALTAAGARRAAGRRGGPAGTGPGTGGSRPAEGDPHTEPVGHRRLPARLRRQRLGLRRRRCRCRSSIETRPASPGPRPSSAWPGAC